MSLSLYNEIDPFCVEWLQNLIAAGEFMASVFESGVLR